MILLYLGGRQFLTQDNFDPPSPCVTPFIAKASVLASKIINPLLRDDVYWQTLIEYNINIITKKDQLKIIL